MRLRQIVIAARDRSKVCDELADVFGLGAPFADPGVGEFGLTNALAHHIDERVAVADLQALTRIYERFIERYFAVKV